MNTTTDKLAPCYCFVTLAMLSVATAHSQNPTIEGSSAEAKLAVSRTLELEATDQYASGEGEHEYVLNPKVELDLHYDHSASVKMGLNIEYSREWEGGNNGQPSEYTTSLLLNEAFIEVSGRVNENTPYDDMSLTLGRRRIRDSREWFYDAEVDGLIMQAESSSLNSTMLLSLNREEWFDSNLLENNDHDPVNNLIVVFEYQPQWKIDLGAYLIARNDTSPENDSPHFFGLSARGQLLDNRLTFWTDIAMVSGKDGEDEIHGHGYDIGTTLKSTKAGLPYVTLSYAYGSGDGDEDTDFRQSGLQDNSDKLGGVSNFKYYGELLDPELSNLTILTAGIGFRPRKKISIDLIYHQYQQDTALDELRDSNLSFDTNGLSTDVGAEVDLVAGLEHFKNIKTEFVLGLFKPGDAYDDRNNVMLFNTKVTYEF